MAAECKCECCTENWGWSSWCGSARGQGATTYTHIYSFRVRYRGWLNIDVTRRTSRWDLNPRKNSNRLLDVRSKGVEFYSAKMRYFYDRCSIFVEKIYNFLSTSKSAQRDLAPRLEKVLSPLSKCDRFSQQQQARLFDQKWWFILGGSKYQNGKSIIWKRFLGHTLRQTLRFGRFILPSIFSFVSQQLHAYT